MLPYGVHSFFDCDRILDVKKAIATVLLLSAENFTPILRVAFFAILVLSECVDLGTPPVRGSEPWLLFRKEADTVVLCLFTVAGRGGGRMMWYLRC